MENQDQSKQQFNAEGKQILNVADPSRATDGANKRYVDANAGGKYLGVVNKTDAFTTASSSFVDITDLTITADVASQKRVLLQFSGPINNDTVGKYTSITFDVDGSNVGGTDGLTMFRQETASYWNAINIHFITNALTAGSHTFKVQAKVDAGTASINSGATNLIFSAIQI